MRDAEPFGVESALYLSGLDETIGGKSSTSHEKVRPYFTDNTEGIGRLLVLSRGEILLFDTYIGNNMIRFLVPCLLTWMNYLFKSMYSNAAANARNMIRFSYERRERFKIQMIWLFYFSECSRHLEACRLGYSEFRPRVPS
jgi:hypothetical protein